VDKRGKLACSREAALWVVCFCAVWLCSGARSAPPDKIGFQAISIIYTSDLLRQLLSCRCSAGDIGGLPELVVELKSELAKREYAIYVDLGNLSRGVQGDGERAAVMARALASAGCAIGVVCPKELEMPLAELTQFARECPCPLLAGNVVFADPEQHYMEKLTGWMAELEDEQGLLLALYSRLESERLKLPAFGGWPLDEAQAEAQAMSHPSPIPEENCVVTVSLSNRPLDIDP